MRLMDSPIFLAFLATLFTWGMTALGAALVFFFKDIKKSMLNTMLGFASGVMIAASFWSLLNPALEMAPDTSSLPAWLVVGIGFMLGGIFLWGADKLLPHQHFSADKNAVEGLPSHLRRSILLVLSITLHNIPEGLAVGVAFGAVANGHDTATIAAALSVAIGIGIQNFPEGAAVSIPLRREGLSRFRCFMYGQASGIVEPISAVLGAFLVTQMRSILPYALAFAAGAMIFVVIEELIPEAQIRDPKEYSKAHFVTAGAMIGFTVMMILDVALA
ncbi:ZIP family metal transporter [Parasphaerochaeta coccoides]|uniref:Zinc/iron permease n=1 Tax=Parasphaerochaeta coccoides (strain ATCC BAA-1237 / DSM 17374 / SPN1) TaxID=760011 RepID=F4GLN9_PARC1|nr:ZIP family metal transporter [Parasphaerochaeta coccoides]AEC02433.1 zinc/iron permease [Parasphaerochaeta coccoides DSM 17374]